jgi:hypothetical protein
MVEKNLEMALSLFQNMWELQLRLQKAEVAFESVMSEFIIAKKLLEDMTGLVFN